MAYLNPLEDPLCRALWKPWKTWRTPAGLWSAAFAFYALRHWPALSRARLDGLPG